MIEVPAGPESSPIFRLERRERDRLIEESRRVLTLQQRLIVTWHYHDEVSLTAIAERLHITRPAVSQQLNRTILPRMRAELLSRGITGIRDIL